MIRLDSINKTYTFDDETVYALEDINLTIENGEFVAVMGASGSGKSTLLNIIGCMDSATGGDYFLDGEPVFGMADRRLCELRSKKMSFVFQNFALMEKYTAYENIELPLWNQGLSGKKRKARVIEAAQQMGIESQLKKLPRQMSGGQQQRVALARAIASGAEVLLADEPTGALDREMGEVLMEHLAQLNQDGTTIILVTHDSNVASYAARVIQIADGRIKKDG